MQRSLRRALAFSAALALAMSLAGAGSAQVVCEKVNKKGKSKFKLRDACKRKETLAVDLAPPPPPALPETRCLQWTSDADPGRTLKVAYAAAPMPSRIGLHDFMANPVEVQVFQVAGVALAGTVWTAAYYPPLSGAAFLWLDYQYLSFMLPADAGPVVLQATRNELGDWVSTLSQGGAPAETGSIVELVCADQLID
jgi:hypothetical protein